MCLAQVLLRLHFQQATDGALELECQPFPLVEQVRLDRGAANQLDAMVVENIDEQNETTRDVIVTIKPEGGGGGTGPSREPGLG